MDLRSSNAFKCTLSGDRPSLKLEKPFRPHFGPKTLLLVLLLAGTGCSQLNDVCQGGISGNTYDWYTQLPVTFAVSVLMALAISVIFYLCQVRKLGKWNLKTSESAPRVPLARLFPFIIILLPILLIVLFFGAECSDPQKGAHIGGVILGWSTGYMIGFLTFRGKTRSYKKIQSGKKKNNSG